MKTGLGIEMRVLMFSLTWGERIWGFAALGGASAFWEPLHLEIMIFGYLPFVLGNWGFGGYNLMIWEGKSIIF